MSDTSWIAFLLILFIGLGWALPYINQSLGEEYTGSQGFNESQMYEGIVGKDETNINTVDIFASILKMFFWTFGALPILIDLFFVVLRILLIILVYRQIRSGGG